MFATEDKVRSPPVRTVLSPKGAKETKARAVGEAELSTKSSQLP